MIRDITLARQISDMMIEISGRLDRSIIDVKERCSPEDLEAYRRAVGQVLGEILLEILNPLYAEHPSIKPPQLE